MKKILSVALSTAMAFSMFASVISAADANLTPQQKFDALKQASIMDGMPDGSSALEKTLTRAELAKIIVKSIGLEPITGVATYKDKNYTVNHWAAPFIEAATQAGILNGKDEAKQLFDPSGNVTVQELAKVLVAALKLEVPAEANNSASEWAKGYVAAAVEKGYLPAGINYQANATRSQAIVAAYAIYEANQVPTVASYTVSEAGKVVEFKLSNDEVVKVTLEKALEANKETEVKFSHNGHDYTHKVTWVVDSAQKVVSASASNLKEVVVVFDGTVDPASAENENNYVVENSANSDGKAVASATLSEDKKTVTLLLADKTSSFLPGQLENVLPSQRETYVQVNNVKNSDGSKTISQKVTFVPLDVTVPEVKEVSALGTKAFKIEFSEPVQNTNLTASNFRVDDKNIAASITYVYPNIIIAETNLSEGEHTLRVSDVKDFSGLTVVPVEKKFTAAVDTAAPKVVSAKTNDLQKVVVEFDEPVKAVSGAYANVSSVKPTKTEIQDKKVILTFGEKALSYTDNKIYLTGVRDYSGNSGNVDYDVTSTLDSTRPTVVTSKFYQESVSGDYIAEIQFSKPLALSSIEDRSNFVLKNSEGKVPNVNGLNSDGHPIRTPQFVANSGSKIVKVNFGSNLNDDNYSLTISGLRDTAYAANVLLPVTINLSVNDAAYGTIVRAYTNTDVVSNGTEVYIQFNKSLATSGEGNALKAEKYVVKQGGLYYQLTANDSDVELISADTIRVVKRNNQFTLSPTDEIQVSYIADTTGKYLDNGQVSYSGNTNQHRYTLTKVIVGRNAAISLNPTSVVASSNEEIKLEFYNPLSNVYARDFQVENTVTGATYFPNDQVLSANGKVLTLKFSGDKLPIDLNNGDLKISTRPGVTYTQDTYGNLVVISTPVGVKNEIKPKWDKNAPRITSIGGDRYEVRITATKQLSDNSNAVNNAKDFFKVTLGNVSATVDALTLENSLNGTDDVIVLTVTAAGSPNTGIYNVYFDGSANERAKALTDATSNYNPLDGFEAR